MISKKDYEKLTRALWQSKTHTIKPLTKKQRAHDASVRTVAIHIASALKADDPNLDVDNFLKDCVLL